MVLSQAHCFVSSQKKKKNSRDYHDEMNGDVFYEWMESVLLRLKKNSVIIMDNASVKIDKAPTTKNNKTDTIKWLEDKNIVTHRPMHKMIIPQLLDIMKKNKPQHEKYFIGELVKRHDCIVLRLLLRLY